MKRFIVRLICSVSLVACSHAPPGHPETVLVTFRAKSGAEAELARVIASHWRAATDLNLLVETPHVTLRGTDDTGKVYFVDVFTWRDPSIPDAAPPAIRKIWAEMNALVESRGGHPGLAFEAVSLVE